MSCNTLWGVYLCPPACPQLSGSLDASAAGGTGIGAAAKLAAVLKERPYCLQLPAEERSSPLGVALVALSGGWV